MTISPCLASEGAVLKNSPSSSTVESAGDVAEGEIITVPLATATFSSIAVVTPEQSPPTIALTSSAVINLSAAAVAAAESIHVESALVEAISPNLKFPAPLTSAIASSAPAPISTVNDSIGPVKPKIIPIFTFEWLPANAVLARIALAAVANRILFIIFSQFDLKILHYLSAFAWGLAS